MSNLVIVESPTKAPVIKSYLGSSYSVKASKGHIRDLPKSTLGIDTERDFEPHYINIRGKGDLIRELKKDAQKADKVFLATDPDREGEAIAWHLAETLEIPQEKIYRVTFNEITKSAVKKAIKQPRKIDMNLVNAQQARRILDRVVGYKASPFLWKTVGPKLSAGRVQSAAVRIIVDREREIRAFVPEEYWTLDADLLTQDGDRLTVRYFGNAGGEKQTVSSASAAAAVADAVRGGTFVTREIRKYVKSKNPAPPFTTSTMQQEASRKLNFQSQRTTRVAQELYEGVKLSAEFGGTHGLITYMRTDSLRVAAEAQDAAASFIAERYGDAYVPAHRRTYKSRNTAQDAHEAIRPSDVRLEPSKIKSFLSPDQFKLYKLIWERFVASQMQNAELNVVTGAFVCGDHEFRASGYTVGFQGYMAVYEESTDDPDTEKNDRIPPLSEGDTLACEDVCPQQHFTEPPARYTEASLIKFLEEKGIGRPSTYTPIITLIIDRGYIVRSGKSLAPTPLGEAVNGVMEKAFPDIVDYRFTADMEGKLDMIGEGDVEMKAVLHEVYDGCTKELERADETVRKEDVRLPVEETDIICDKCGARMVIKSGKFGKFAACPNFPACKNTKQLNAPVRKPAAEPKKIELAPFKCDVCGADMVVRNGRYGQFYACSNFPACKNTKQKNRPLDVKCPLCGGKLVVKFGRNRSTFYACDNYPACKFTSWDLPTPETCPNCGSMLFRKKGKNLLVCKKEGCGYQSEQTAPEADSHG